MTRRPTGEPAPRRAAHQARNTLPPETVVISEVLPGGAQPAGDTVELYNVTYRDMDLGGWYLSNSDDDYLRFRVPAGTTIAARGYQVFNQTQLGFALDKARGDQLWLVRPDAQGRPVQFVDVVSFGTTAPGISLGPWPELTSPLRNLAETTLGAAQRRDGYRRGGHHGGALQPARPGW